MELYDSIGQNYSTRRRPDPRIEARVLGALGDSRSILNVGAGAGSYEPTDRRVVAVEPSRVMIHQRPPGASPVVRASASALPFADESFEATLAILTIHHWPDLSKGLRELRRTAQKRVVLLTFDTSVGGFWLTDYFPEIFEIDLHSMPSLSEIERHLGRLEISEVPIPHDCVDGFLGANWRRPRAYLDSRVRAATSVFAKIADTEAGLHRLETDLDSGEWHRRYGQKLPDSEIDLGYRLVVAEL